MRLNIRYNEVSEKFVAFDDFVKSRFFAFAILPAKPNTFKWARVKKFRSEFTHRFQGAVNCLNHVVHTALIAIEPMVTKSFAHSQKNMDRIFTPV